MNELEHILSKRYDQEILLKLFQKYFVNWIADGYIGKELNIFEISTIGEKTDKEVGVIDAMQKTWSEGAHSTEIRGGLSNFHPENYSEKTKEEFMFDMNGKTILSLCIKKVPKMMKEFLENNNMKISDIDMVVPHQASVAMPLVMEKLGVPKDKYIDEVKDFGNMVSASVPMTLAHSLEKQKIKNGDIMLLIGTAAGLTTNMMLIKI